MRRIPRSKNHRTKLSAFPIAIAMIGGLLFASPAAAQTPTCASAESDPDGDGWGWENEQSCRVEQSTPTTTTSIPTPTPETPTNPTNERVVISMGDSYISGESGHLIGNYSAERRPNAYEAGTDTNFQRCRRSDVAPINSASIPGVTAINIACSGATTSDIGRISEPVNSFGRYGEGLQIHRLRDIAEAQDVEMVVVSIGGNDLGFEDLATSCTLRYASGSNCENRDASTYESRMTNVMAPNVTNTIQEIKDVLWAAGDRDARIVLQSYPSPVPATTQYASAQRAAHGCAFKASDMRYINMTFVPLLDSTLEDVARNLGVEFLSLSDAFDGKELCSPYVTSRNQTANHSELEWATGIRLASNSATAESLHPNALGQQAIGECIQLVWQSSSTNHKCFNNNGAPNDMRLGGVNNSPGNATIDTPNCVTASADPDGDGWGWENGRSCFMAIAPGDVDCTGVSGNEAQLCELIMDRINNELDVGRVSLDRDGLLFTYDNPDKFRINDARCTNRAYITHQNATARIRSGATLDLEGSSITDPVGLRVTVPFALSARVDARSELHWNFFGSCNNLGTDSYDATASFSGTADMLVAFNLDPSFDVDANGDLVLTVEPRAHVALDLRDPDLDFRVSGVNPIAQFYAAATGLTRTLSDAIEAGISGDSMSDAIAAREMDLGLPVGLSVAGLLTTPVLWDLIDGSAERAIQQEAQNFSPDVEASLNAQIADALELDANGQREFVIPVEFAALLQGGASLDDLLLLAS